MTVADRRDIRRRSEAVSRIVQWLNAQHLPIRAVPDDVADSAAATRILKKLALRGLVRRVEGGWCATRVLSLEGELVLETQ